MFIVRNLLMGIFVLIGTNTVQLAAEDFYTIAPTIIAKVAGSQPAESSIRKIYEVSNNQPIWVTPDGLSPLGIGLLDQIENDPLLSHNTQLYKEFKSLQSLSSNYTTGVDTKQQIKIEFKLSKLYKNYANFKIYGLINWPIFRGRLQQIIVTDDIHADWEIYPKYTVFTLLQEIIESGNIRASFDETSPKTQLYLGLEKWYLHYKKIAQSGEWPNIPAFGTIKPGESNGAIPAIRTRLYLSGDMEGCEPSQSDIYDQCLVNAVKTFQKRHGQTEDGVIGKGTAIALRESIDNIITRMELNLDRIKMMKPNDYGRYIMVNIPAFRLYFYENGEVFQTMKVITGQKKHPTPVFSDTIETAVLNPYWNVPKNIIQKEMIPKLLRNPNAMQREGIEIRNGWEEDAPLISGSSVDWSQYQFSNSVPYRFAQVPGNGNALGKVKFLFPNKFSVYMHDTPTKNLFSRQTRAFSHGCIRLEKPKELFKTFAELNPSINYEQSQEILKGKKQSYYKLDETPINIAYLTAWVLPDGTLQMRDDIYGYDGEQLKYRNTY